MAKKSVKKKAQAKGNYRQIIGHIFSNNYRPGKNGFFFDREEIGQAATALGLDQPKNLGDVIYTYRFRRNLPKEITDTEPEELSWIIRLAGIGRYRFQLVSLAHITPTRGLATTKIPDATPEIVSKYALGDEQALLAKLRYNRLIDIFLGMATYSLQNHLRTTVEEVGQIEIDEVYVGVDEQGRHFIIPVQAKGGRDKLHVVQTEQDMLWSKTKYPQLITRALSAQFMANDRIAIFELAIQEDEIRMTKERHYELVPGKDITPEDLQNYSELGDSP